MRQPNPLRDALAEGRFCYMVEVVASRISREARLLEISSQLAQVPGIVAGSVTSYAGGSPGHDPIRIGTAARARGLTPNIHLTCVSRDRVELRRTLEDIHALGIENVFALTGDYPGQGAPPVFDLDSVSLVTLINEMREAGRPYLIAVAVSPFKYTEPDCMYQYLKLEKKFAAGADYAITQVGWDSRKFRELKRYLDERNIVKPVLGNVYLLGKRAAQKMAKGEPPGCWVSQELVQQIEAESGAKDAGEAARLERAARTVAILRGLGYAGAYFGGTHKAEHLRWIIKRSEAIAPHWEEYAEEIAYGPKSAFYLYETPKAPPKPMEPLPKLFNWMGRMFPVRTDTPLRRLLTKSLRWIDRRPKVSHALEQAELAFKVPVFGCQSCGNCVLGDLEYVCPQTCPKQLRNGPCGGTNNGACEVIPSQSCIWVKVYERAKVSNEVQSLKTFVPAPDRSLKGTSSYINYFLGKDVRPHPIAKSRPVDKPPAAGDEPERGNTGKTDDKNKEAVVSGAGKSGSK